jgi:hypothetical protein
MVRRDGGRVFIDDEVAASNQVSGEVLCEAYLASIRALTFGLIREHDGSLWLGPIELMRFGTARISESAVEWPIAGGRLAGEPGGSLRVKREPGRISVAVEGYRPALPWPVYRLTQLPVHHLMVRLFMLGVRGRVPPPGRPAARSDRNRAAAIDIGLCATLAVLTGRRHRIARFAGIAVGYHVACWSLTGRTLGGLALNHRVVSVDGSRLSVAQALLRFASLPVSLFRSRYIHDQIACTDVIEE